MFYTFSFRVPPGCPFLFFNEESFNKPFPIILSSPLRRPFGDAASWRHSPNIRCVSPPFHPDHPWLSIPHVLLDRIPIHT